jgi:hypothetical protein
MIIRLRDLITIIRCTFCRHEWETFKVFRVVNPESEDYQIISENEIRCNKCFMSRDGGYFR